MRTAIMLVASLALCTVAYADGPGQGRGSFSSGRSMGSQHSGQSAGRAHSAPRSSGNFRSYRSEGRSASGRTFSEGRNFSGGRNVTGGRNFSGGRNVDTPAFRANPRPGFQTTRPDLGNGRATRPGFSTRPDMNPGDRWNGDRWNNGGNRSSDRRWDFDRRPGFDGRPGTNNNFNGNVRSRPGFSTNPGFNRGSGWHGGSSFSHRSHHWHGGYWKGRFWPRAYYYPNYVSFWPYLPASYVTFWYGGLSYYYVNDLYYTWSPARYGYVVTDPPPAAESAATVSSESTEPGPGSVYVYPRNGQSEEQTATDRFECHQWAVSQTGFDPSTATADTQSAGSASDYRRALIACLDARGYSAN
jgi:hypothetical protein